MTGVISKFGADGKPIASQTDALFNADGSITDAFKAMMTRASAAAEIKGVRSFCEMHNLNISQAALILAMEGKISAKTVKENGDIVKVTLSFNAVTNSCSVTEILSGTVAFNSKGAKITFDDAEGIDGQAITEQDTQKMRDAVKGAVDVKSALDAGFKLCHIDETGKVRDTGKKEGNNKFYERVSALMDVGLDGVYLNKISITIEGMGTFNFESKLAKPEDRIFHLVGLKDQTITLMKYDGVITSFVKRGEIEGEAYAVPISINATDSATAISKVSELDVALAGASTKSELFDAVKSMSAGEKPKAEFSKLILGGSEYMFTNGNCMLSVGVMTQDGTAAKLAVDVTGKTYNETVSISDGLRTMAAGAKDIAGLKMSLTNYNYIGVSQVSTIGLIYEAKKDGAIVVANMDFKYDGAGNCFANFDSLSGKWTINANKMQLGDSSLDVTISKDSKHLYIKGDVELSFAQSGLAKDDSVFTAKGAEFEVLAAGGLSIVGSIKWQTKDEKGTYILTAGVIDIRAGNSLFIMDGDLTLKDSAKIEANNSLIKEFKQPKGQEGGVKQAPTGGEEIHVVKEGGKIYFTNGTIKIRNNEAVATEGKTFIFDSEGITLKIGNAISNGVKGSFVFTALRDFIESGKDGKPEIEKKYKDGNGGLMSKGEYQRITAQNFYYEKTGKYLMVPTADEAVVSLRKEAAGCRVEANRATVLSTSDEPDARAAADIGREQLENKASELEIMAGRLEKGELSVIDVLFSGKLPDVDAVAKNADEEVALKEFTDCLNQGKFESADYQAFKFNTLRAAEAAVGYGFNEVNGKKLGATDLVKAMLANPEVFASVNNSVKMKNDSRAFMQAQYEQAGWWNRVGISMLGGIENAAYASDLRVFATAAVGAAAITAAGITVVATGGAALGIGATACWSAGAVTAAGMSVGIGLGTMAISAGAQRFNNGSVDWASAFGAGVMGTGESFLFSMALAAPGAIINAARATAYGINRGFSVLTSLEFGMTTSNQFAAAGTGIFGAIAGGSKAWQVAGQITANGLMGAGFAGGRYFISDVLYQGQEFSFGRLAANMGMGLVLGVVGGGVGAWTGASLNNVSRALAFGLLTGVSGYLDQGISGGGWGLGGKNLGDVFIGIGISAAVSITKFAMSPAVRFGSSTTKLGALNQRMFGVSKNAGFATKAFWGGMRQLMFAGIGAGTKLAVDLTRYATGGLKIESGWTTGHTVWSLVSGAILGIVAAHVFSGMGAMHVSSIGRNVMNYSAAEVTITKQMAAEAGSISGKIANSVLSRVLGAGFLKEGAKVAGYKLLSFEMTKGMVTWIAVAPAFNVFQGFWNYLGTNIKNVFNGKGWYEHIMISNSVTGENVMLFSWDGLRALATSVMTAPTEGWYMGPMIGIFTLKGVTPERLALGEAKAFMQNTTRAAFEGIGRVAARGAELGWGLFGGAISDKAKISIATAFAGVIGWTFGNFAIAAYVSGIGYALHALSQEHGKGYETGLGGWLVSKDGSGLLSWVFLFMKANVDTNYAERQASKLMGAVEARFEQEVQRGNTVTAEGMSSSSNFDRSARVEGQKEVRKDAARPEGQKGKYGELTEGYKATREAGGRIFSEWLKANGDKLSAIGRETNRFRGAEFSMLESAITSLSIERKLDRNVVEYLEAKMIEKHGYNNERGELQMLMGRTITSQGLTAIESVKGETAKDIEKVARQQQKTNDRIGMYALLKAKQEAKIDMTKAEQRLLNVLEKAAALPEAQKHKAVFDAAKTALAERIAFSWDILNDGKIVDHQQAKALAMALDWQVERFESKGGVGQINGNPLIIALACGRGKTMPIEMLQVAFIEYVKVNHAEVDLSSLRLMVITDCGDNVNKDWSKGKDSRTFVENYINKNHINLSVKDVAKPSDMSEKAGGIFVMDAKTLQSIYYESPSALKGFHMMAVDEAEAVLSQVRLTYGAQADVVSRFTSSQRGIHEAYFEMTNQLRKLTDSVWQTEGRATDKVDQRFGANSAFDRDSNGETRVVYDKANEWINRILDNGANAQMVDKLGGREDARVLLANYMNRASDIITKGSTFNGLVANPNRTAENPSTYLMQGANGEIMEGMKYGDMVKSLAAAQRFGANFKDAINEMYSSSSGGVSIFEALEYVNKNSANGNNIFTGFAGTTNGANEVLRAMRVRVRDFGTSTWESATGKRVLSDGAVETQHNIDVGTVEGHARLQLHNEQADANSSGKALQIIGGEDYVTMQGRGRSIAEARASEINGKVDVPEHVKYEDANGNSYHATEITVRDSNGEQAMKIIVYESANAFDLAISQAYKLGTQGEFGQSAHLISRLVTGANPCAINEKTGKITARVDGKTVDTAFDKVVGSTVGNLPESGEVQRGSRFNIDGRRAPTVELDEKGNVINKGNGAITHYTDISTLDGINKVGLQELRELRTGDESAAIQKVREHMQNANRTIDSRQVSEYRLATDKFMSESQRLSSRLQEAQGIAAGIGRQLDAGTLSVGDAAAQLETQAAQAVRLGAVAAIVSPSETLTAQALSQVIGDGAVLAENGASLVISSDETAVQIGQINVDASQVRINENGDLAVEGSCNVTGANNANVNAGTAKLVIIGSSELYGQNISIKVEGNTVTVAVAHDRFNNDLNLGAGTLAASLMAAVGKVSAKLATMQDSPQNVVGAANSILTSCRMLVRSLADNTLAMSDMPPAVNNALEAVANSANQVIAKAGGKMTEEERQEFSSKVETTLRHAAAFTQMGMEVDKNLTGALEKIVGKTMSQLQAAATQVAAQAAQRVNMSGIIVTLGEEVVQAEGIGSAQAAVLSGFFEKLNTQLNDNNIAGAAETAKLIKGVLSGERFDKNPTVVATRAVMETIVSNRTVSASAIIITLGEELVKTAENKDNPQLVADMTVQFKVLANQLAANNLQGAVFMLGLILDAKENGAVVAAINANPAVLAALNNIADQARAQGVNVGATRQQAAAIRTQIVMMRSGVTGNVAESVIGLGARLGSATVSVTEARKISDGIERDVSGTVQQDAVKPVANILDNMIANRGAQAVKAAGRQMAAEAKAAGVEQTKASELNSTVDKLAQAVKTGDVKSAKAALAQIEKMLSAGNVAVNSAMTRCKDVVASMKQGAANAQVQATVAVQNAVRKAGADVTLGAEIVALSTDLGAQETTPENTQRLRNTYNSIVSRLNGAANSQALAPTLALLDTVIAAREARVMVRQQVNAVALAAASQGRPMSQAQKTSLERRMLAANNGVTIKNMAYVLNINGRSVTLKEKTGGVSLISRLNSNREEIAQKAGVAVSVVDAMIISVITQTGGSYEVSLGETVGESGKAVFDFDASGNLTRIGTTRTYQQGVEEAVDIHTGHEGLALSECVGDIAAMIRKAQITGTPLAQMVSYILAKDGSIGELRFDAERNQFTLRVASIGGQFGEVQPFTGEIIRSVNGDIADAVSAAVSNIDPDTGRVAAAATDLPAATGEAGKVVVGPVTVTMVSETTATEPAVFELRIERTLAALRGVEAGTESGETMTASSGEDISASVFTGRAGPSAGTAAGEALGQVRKDAMEEQPTEVARENVTGVAQQSLTTGTAGIGASTTLPSEVIVTTTQGSEIGQDMSSIISRIHDLRKEGAGIGERDRIKIEVVDKSSGKAADRPLLGDDGRVFIEEGETARDTMAKVLAIRKQHSGKKCEIDVTLNGDRPDFGDFVEAFARLAENSKGMDRVILMVQDSSTTYKQVLEAYADCLERAAVGSGTIVIAKKGVNLTRPAIIRLKALREAGKIGLNDAVSQAVTTQTDQSIESEIEAEIAY
jgi:hypothetical protein